MPYYTKDLKRDHDFDNHPYGCFHELWVLFMGILITRALLLGVCVGAPDFRQNPKGAHLGLYTLTFGLLHLQKQRSLQVQCVLPWEIDPCSGNLMVALVSSRALGL